MKTTRKFLFLIPVETRRSRRALVIGYYFFFIALAVVLVWFRGPTKYDRLIPLSFYLATMLGGILVPGPVRMFSQWQRRLQGVRDEPVDGLLGLSGRQPSSPRPGDRLDEHDLARRDRAHYLAYSTLRLPAMLVIWSGGYFFLKATPAQAEHALYILSVPLAALFFSLPQAIILWTEPDLDPDTIPDPAGLAASGAHHA